MRIKRNPLLLLPAIIAIFAIASQPRDANAYSDNASSSATSTSSDILMCSLNISENEEEEKIIMALCQQEHLDQYNGHDGHDDDDDDQDDDDQDDKEYKYDHVGAIGSEQRSHRRYYNRMKKNEILLDKDENLSQLPHPKTMCSPSSSNIKKMHDGNKASTTVKKKIKVKKRIRQGFHAKENELSATHHDSVLMMQQEETNPESPASFLSKTGGGSGGGGAWNQPQVQQDLQKHEVESISARQNQRQHPQQQQKAHLLLQHDTHGATSTMAVASSKNSHHPLRLHTTRTGTNLIIPAAFVKSNEQKNLQQKENQEKKEKQEWEKQEWEVFKPSGMPLQTAAIAAGTTATITSTTTTSKGGGGGGRRGRKNGQEHYYWKIMRLVPKL